MHQEGWPQCDCSVMVSRAEKRPDADFWPIRHSDRLPVIPIPPHPQDAAARVDLQEAQHLAFDGPGYEHFIYRGEPEPSLPANDAARARRFVPAVESGRVGCAAPTHPTTVASTGGRDRDRRILASGDHDQAHAQVSRLHLPRSPGSALVAGTSGRYKSVSCHLRA